MILLLLFNVYNSHFCAGLTIESMCLPFKVTDMDGAPLAGVLLSLSAGQFRSNNVTFDNGSMSFINLVSKVDILHFSLNIY